MTPAKKSPPRSVLSGGGGRPWRGNNNGCKEQKETFELVLAIGRDAWSGSPALKPFLVLDHVSQSFLFLKHRTPVARCPFRQALQHSVCAFSIVVGFAQGVVSSFAQFSRPPWIMRSAILGNPSSLISRARVSQFCARASHASLSAGLLVSAAFRRHSSARERQSIWLVIASSVLHLHHFGVPAFALERAPVDPRRANFNTGKHHLCSAIWTGRTLDNLGREWARAHDGAISQNAPPTPLNTMRKTSAHGMKALSKILSVLALGSRLTTCSYSWYRREQDRLSAIGA